MILAAGRGERLRPLTDSLPKPLILVGNKPLIVWHLERLARGGIKEVVINLAHLGEQIERTLGNGQHWGLTIRYSHETQGALETAGGIRHALSLLGDDPFLLINGDVFTDFPLPTLMHTLNRFKQDTRAHLVLVPNPEHHPTGDFSLDEHGNVRKKHTLTHTFSGISLLSPSLFSNLLPNQVAKLAPILNTAIEHNQVTGELFKGVWLDVGTKERLQQAHEQARLWI